MTTIRETLDRMLGDDHTVDRRRALQILGAGFALASVGVAATATAQEKKAAPAPTRTKAEVVALPAELSKLDKAKYVVVTGPAPEAKAAGIICQHGSNYYVDHRKADSMVVVYDKAIEPPR